MAEGTIAKAYVQVMPSMQGVQGSLEKEFGAQGSSSGSLFGSSLVKKALAVVSVAKLGQALGETLSQGAELQQNLGGVQAVFGEFASSITASAQQAYQNMGLSASDYMATANKMGSLFQGSGLTQQRSLELTAQAMQRAADVASVMGIDTSMAMESIAGAAKGNFTMMDNLGVAMNATTLEAYALEKGVNFKWNTASNAEKAELAMEMFFDRTSQYADNFRRESEETFSGAFGAMKAAAQNVLGNLALGKSMTPSLQALARTTATFLTGNLLPMVLNIVAALPGAAVTFLQALLPGNMGSLATTAVTSFCTFLTGSFPAILAQGNQMLSQLVLGFLSAVPDFLTAAGSLLLALGTAILAAAPALMEKGITLILHLASGLLAALPNVASAGVSLIAGLLTTFAGYLPDLLAQGISLIGQLVAGLISMIPDVISAGADIAGDLLNEVLAVDWLGLGRDIIGGIISGLWDAAASLVGAIKDIVSQALKAAKEKLGIKSPSRVFRDEVGRWIPAGIAAGIWGGMGLVTDALDSLKDTASADVTAALGLTASGGSQSRGGLGGRTVNLTQNIYSRAMSAAELAMETRYRAEEAVLLGV